MQAIENINYLHVVMLKEVYDVVVLEIPPDVLDERHSRLTVELSGARAAVRAWHFIYHASAPAIC